MLMRYAAVCLDGTDGGVLDRRSGGVLDPPPPIPNVVAMALDPLAVRLNQLGLAAGTGLLVVVVVVGVTVEGKDVVDPVATMLTGDFERG
jgi:hypothetical protein